MDELKNYFNDDPIELYTGSDREQRQLNTLIERFNDFITKGGKE